MDQVLGGMWKNEGSMEVRELFDAVRSHDRVLHMFVNVEKSGPRNLKISCVQVGRALPGDTFR
jgi:hypothetical protein